MLNSCLAQLIHCNSDGIFNDDKYDYDSIGFPFMKNLGRVIYEHELKRERKLFRIFPLCGLIIQSK